MTDKITDGLQDAVAFAKGEASARVTIKQSRGPTIEFEGRLLASTEWEAREGLMRIELYQTKGGALIPVTRSTFEDGRRALVSATVVETGAAGAAGFYEQSARFDVMDFWDWTDRARSMVREQLGWTLKRVVE